MKKNHQVGEVREIKGRKAIIQLGMMPITVDLGDLTVVSRKIRALATRGWNAGSPLAVLWFLRVMKLFPEPRR